MNIEKNDKHSLEALAVMARLRLLKLHYDIHHGHLGGDLSCIDSLIVLFHSVLKKDDVFILSKGHSAGTLYIAMWSKGLLNEDDLNTFAKDGTRLGIHPPVKGLDSVVFGTGSLGHGFSLAAGLALGKKLKRESGRVYCLCGDGEWQEGSCWEALTFAVHKKLDNLSLLIDANGWQGFGSTEQVASVSSSDLCERLRSFGPNIVTCDGHDLKALNETLPRTGKTGMPSVILMKTVKGKGVACLENTLASHYLPLTREQYEEARRALGGGDA